MIQVLGFLIRFFVVFLPGPVLRDLFIERNFDYLLIENICLPTALTQQMWASIIFNISSLEKHSSTYFFANLQKVPIHTLT